MGWLLLAIAFGNAINLVADFLAIRGLLSGASPASWVAWPGWVYSQTSGIGAFLLLTLIFFFPDGRLPGPRWRWVAVGAAVVVVLQVAEAMVATGRTTLSPRVPDLPNPIGVDALNGLVNGPIFNVGPLLVLVVALCAVVARYRRSREVERSQLRWFAYAGAASLAVIVAGYAVSPANGTVGNFISGGGFALGLGVAIPVTIGLAIIRNGLFDIDVFISRTLVYGSLAVFITAVYVGIAVGIGTLVGSGGKPNLGLSALATGIVAVGFQPVRERVQRVANRLVYGTRATPYEVLSQFSERVAESYASEDVLPRMARVLGEGTNADLAEVWLRHDDALQRAADFPLDEAVPAATPRRPSTSASSRPSRTSRSTPRHPARWCA